MRARLQELVKTNGHFDRAFLASGAGIEVCDWPPDPTVLGKSFAFRDWYRGVSSLQATYVSEVYLRAGAPRLDVVSVTTPVRAPDGDTAGYLVAQYPLATLSRRLQSIWPAGLGKVRLIDHHGHLAEARAEPEDDPLVVSSALVAEALAGRESSSIERDPGTGADSLRTFAPVPAIGWVVSAEQPADAVHAPAVALQHAIVASSVLCLLGMLALGFSCLEVVRRHHLALLELQELKQQLGGMIVHDLRNPLTAAILSIDLVGEASAALGEEARRDLRNAALSARRMRALIDSILDVMKMEAGAMELRRAPADLAALVHAKVDEYRALAGAGALRLEPVVPAAPVRAEVDAGLLARVLDNLIANAIKHTPAGGRVEVRLAEEDAAGPIALSVSDTGEGIPPEDLPRLFQRFARATGQTLGQAQDAGLGLVFCRLAVELHGGRIGVESTPGRGSTFRLELPRT